jgi:hypothetical protein
MRYITTMLALFLLSGTATAQYNFYYGNLHSHTGYSDGSDDSLTSGVSTPAGAYAYAKLSYHMDFLGISEHNHIQAGMKSGLRYRSGVAQAAAANQDGSFVSLFGMEWGVISGGGHVLVYGIDSLVGWDKMPDGITNHYDILCAKSDYTALWNVINARPGAFATLAHPGTTDYGNLLSAPYNTAAETAISGTAIRSGSAFSTTNNYTDAPPRSYEFYYQRLLAKGYHAAPGMDADNHNTTFGRTHRCRTVVLSTSLRRDSILSAVKRGRYYASDDWNAQVVFTVNGNYMGSDAATGSNSSIYLAVNDPDLNDNTGSISIITAYPAAAPCPRCSLRLQVTV